MIAATSHHQGGGFRVADILNSPESDHRFEPSTFITQQQGSVYLSMSEDRTLPPPTSGGYQYPGPPTLGDSASSATANSPSGLITPGTIPALVSSSNLAMMQGSSHGCHPYASGYSAHLHHLHGPHGDSGTSGGGIRRHGSSARNGYMTAPVSVAASPINSRPASPVLHPTSHRHHHGMSRKMALYTSGDGVSHMPYHHTHNHHSHPHQIGQGRTSLAAVRRHPHVWTFLHSLATSPSSSNLSHTKHTSATAILHSRSVKLLG